MHVLKTNTGYIYVSLIGGLTGYDLDVNFSGNCSGRQHFHGLVVLTGGIDSKTGMVTGVHYSSGDTDDDNFLNDPDVIAQTELYLSLLIQ